MTEAPAEPAALPSLAEAKEWIGHEVDEIDGGGIGTVQGFFLDADNGRPTWLIAKLGRLGGRLVAIPIRSCAAAAGQVWVAHERDAIRGAPVVDPTRPLLREHELTISSHYGIGEGVGRASEVAGRPQGSVTSRPAAG
jgi:hypothetical protein